MARTDIRVRTLVEVLDEHDIDTRQVQIVISFFISVVLVAVPRMCQPRGCRRGSFHSRNEAGAVIGPENPRSLFVSVHAPIAHC